MSSSLLLRFAPGSERCLFFQIGKQFIGNINTEDFPKEWAPLQAYMEEQAKGAGVDRNVVKDICGVQMYSHWFTRSQFCLISEKHYLALAEAFPGYFTKSWIDLKVEWDHAREVITSRTDGLRGYFDNTHDIMRDVWQFERVYGEERWGHATPKPVEMMERVMRSSLPPVGLCYEPFGGSGSTLIGAEISGRACYTMELEPAYVDVIVERWEQVSGEKPEKVDA